MTPPEEQIFQPYRSKRAYQEVAFGKDEEARRYKVRFAAFTGPRLMERRQGQEMGGGLHGGLRRDDRLDGPGYRTHH